VHGFSGTLDRLHLGDLLEWLSLTHASGRLGLSAGSVNRSFEIRRGKVTFASSSRAAERLASWLLRKEILPRRTLLLALAVSQSRGELLSNVLRRDAGVSRDALIEAGRGLATALAARILREERVEFVFDPGTLVAAEDAIDLDLECSNLIMQAALRVDTIPPGDTRPVEPQTTLDDVTLERVFWRIMADLDGELVEAGSFADAHAGFLAVGDVLGRWVSQGPPLLPLGPVDVERVEARLARGEAVTIEDSPTLIWDLLSLVNGLDAPGFSRGASARDAWLMAGDDAPTLVRLVLDNSNWRRGRRDETDRVLHRSAVLRGAAARRLAGVVGLSEDVAATVGALPVVLLELVATALGTTPLANAAMQRCALHHLVPLVGQAAAVAAGLPEVLTAALTFQPADSPAVLLSALVAQVAGGLHGFNPPPVPAATLAKAGVGVTLAAARAAIDADA